MITFERGSILRLFFSLLTMHTWFCGLFEPKSLHFAVTNEADLIGLIVINLFGILGVLALIDTVVNDLMLSRYKFPWLLKARHLLFMGIALLNACELFVAVKFVSSWGLALYCLLVCTFVVITAFKDVNLRYSDTKNARA